MSSLQKEKFDMDDFHGVTKSRLKELEKGQTSYLGMIFVVWILLILLSSVVYILSSAAFNLVDVIAIEDFFSLWEEFLFAIAPYYAVAILVPGAIWGIWSTNRLNRTNRPKDDSEYLALISARSRRDSQNRAYYNAIINSMDSGEVLDPFLYVLIVANIKDMPPLPPDIIPSDEELRETHDLKKKKVKANHTFVGSMEHRPIVIHVTSNNPPVYVPGIIASRLGGDRVWELIVSARTAFAIVQAVGNDTGYYGYHREHLGELATTLKPRLKARNLLGLEHALGLDDSDFDAGAVSDSETETGSEVEN